MKIIGTLICSVSLLVANAQTDPLTIREAIDLALKQNPKLLSASLDVEAQKQLKKTGFDLPKTSISLLYGQYNGYPKQDNNITITQSIPFAAFGSQAALNRSLAASSELKRAATENDLVYQVRQVFYALAFAKDRHNLLLQQDSIYSGFSRSAALRYKTGEANLLEQTTAEMQSDEAKILLQQNEATINVLRSQLRTLVNGTNLPEIDAASLPELTLTEFDTSVLSSNPWLSVFRQQVDVAKSEKKLQNARFAPDLLIGYFNQTLIDVPNLEKGTLATAADRFTGFQVGLSMPLWFVPHQGRSKAAAYSAQAAESSYQNERLVLEGQLQQAAEQYTRLKSNVSYYRESALPNADLILKQVHTALRSGNIGYTEYLLGVRNALRIKDNFLQALNDYNQSIIYIEYLTGSRK